MGEDQRQAEFHSTVRALRDHVEFEMARGLRWFPAAERSASAAPAARAQAVVRPARSGRSGGAPTSPARVRDAAPAVANGTSLAPEVAAAESVEDLRAVLGDCQRCKLSGGRTHIVFGVGSPRADLMFVGEGPGRDEDRQGEPFVGRAGQLLTEIITKGMKLRREDVYIANVIKCRPPQNRNPEPDEIDSCLPFLARQIEIVRPRVIVALGKFAAQTLLDSRTPITRMRGEWHEYRGVKLMPTLHPAYLLRNPADKRLVWADIKQVMVELGLPS